MVLEDQLQASSGITMIHLSMRRRIGFLQEVVCPLKMKVFIFVGCTTGLAKHCRNVLKSSLTDMLEVVINNAYTLNIYLRGFWSSHGARAMVDENIDPDDDITCNTM